MKTIYTLFASIILVFIVSSCSKDGPEINKTWKKYHVNYNEQNNHFNITADYKYDGPTGNNIKLNYPVYFGDQELNWNPIAMNYRLDQKSYIPTGVFYWKDEDGVTSQFETNIYITKLPTSIKTIGSDNDFKLYFDGEKLVYNEEITMFMTDANGVTKSFTQDVYQAEYINIIKDRLDELQKGEVSVYFHRVVKGPFTDHAQGGEFTIEYTGDVQTVTLN